MTAGLERMVAQTRLVVWGGKQWFPSGYILKMELTGFANRLSMGYYNFLQDMSSTWLLDSAASTFDNL